MCRKQIVVVASVVAAAVLATSAPAIAAPAPATTERGSHAAVRSVASGWIPYWHLSEGLAATLAHPTLLRDVSLFWDTVTRAGRVQEQEPGVEPDRATLDAAVASIRAQGVRVFITVNDQGFNATAMVRLLQDPARRARLVDSLVSVASRSGADGIDIDFEAMNFGTVGADRTTVKLEFPTFLGDLRAALHAAGLRLSVALPARTGPHDPSWEVFDYRTISANVDRARVMTYDAHSMSTTAGPIAPLSWVGAVGRYAARRFGPRLSLGTPAYGYTWYVRTLSGVCPAGVRSATIGSTQDMLDIAAREHQRPTYVPSVGEYTFSYLKGYRGGGHQCRVRRVVWFEDARSLTAKLDVLRRNHIGSVSFWTLGDERRASWRVLRGFATTG